MDYVKQSSDYVTQTTARTVGSFKSFLASNGVISTAAGITIGFATATFVKSFVADVIMPLIFLMVVNIVSRINKKGGSFFEKFLANKEFRFTNFVSEFITWILIIVAAFLILDLFVRKYLVAQNVPATGGNVFAPPPAAVPSVVPPPPKVKEEYAQSTYPNWQGSPW